MKNDKKTNTPSFWHRWTHRPHFLKNLFIFLAFFIFFTISIVLIWKRQVEKQTHQASPSVVAQQMSPTVEVPPPPVPAPAPPPPPPPPSSPPTPTPVPVPAPPSLEGTVQTLSDRLAALEERLNQHHLSLQMSYKLAALELLKGVLEGLIPLDPLKTFLQKIPDPWAAPLLATLAPLGDIKDYAHLEALLVLPESLESPSLWQRIKRKLKSLVSIRRLDEKGEHTLGTLEDVQKALQGHNLQKALECFEKLPAEDQAAFSSWKKIAQDRFFLETMQKTLLLEMAGG